MTVEQLPNQPQISELISILEAAEHHVIMLIQDSLASGAVGTPAFYRRRLTLIRNQLASLRGQIQPKIDRVAFTSYAFGVSLVDREAGKADLDFGSGLHKQGLDLITVNLRQNIDAAIATLGRRVDDVFRRESLRRVALHTLSGEPYRKSAAALADQLHAHGISAFTDRAGKQWGLKTYTQMVIRTTTREAVSQGSRNRMIERGYDLVKISSHKHKSDVCSQYDGKTFSLTGLVEGYPVLDKLPPFHPNCRHVLTVSHDNFLARTQELLAHAHEQAAA